MTGERTSGRTTVHCAADSFVCNHAPTRKGRVALASDVCVAAHPGLWGVVGTVDAEWAARIAVMGDAATIDRLIDHILPIGAEGSSTAPAPAASGPQRHAGPDLIATRAEVEAIREELASKQLPHGYKSIARKGGWSVATVRRRLAGN
jgi:hypothetical protein